jgi:uncharacterized membrane protein
MSVQNPNTRLETFCDGVIAIAITLLVIEIKVPKHEDVHTVAELWSVLAHKWPSYFAFTLSFGTILIAWVNHHSLFKYLNKTSNEFVYANGLFLLSIAVLPFPTALMADFIDTEFYKPAIIVYSFVSLFHNFCWIVLFKATMAPKQLAINDLAAENIREGLKYCYAGFALYSLICVIAFWFPLVSLGLTVLSWVSWTVIGVIFYKEVKVA